MLRVGKLGLAIRNRATYHPPVQTYAVKFFGPFFSWVHHAEDAAVQSLMNFKNMDTLMTMNELKLCGLCTSQPSYNGSPPTCQDQR